MGSLTRAGRPLSQATLLHPASWGLLRRPLGAHRASRRGPPSVRPVLGFALTCAVQAGLGPPSKVEGLVSHCLHVRRAGAHTCAVWNSVARTDAMASERPGVRGHPTVFTSVAPAHIHAPSGTASRGRMRWHRNAPACVDIECRAPPGHGSMSTPGATRGRDNRVLVRSRWHHFFPGRRHGAARLRGASATRASAPVSAAPRARA